jgi:hypothetical protein
MRWTASFITEKDRKEFKLCGRLKPPVWYHSIYFRSYAENGMAIDEVLEIYRLEKDKFIVIRRNVEPTDAYFLVKNGKRKYSIPTVKSRVNVAIEFMNKQGVEHVIEYINNKYAVLFP